MAKLNPKPPLAIINDTAREQTRPLFGCQPHGPGRHPEAVISVNRNLDVIWRVTVNGNNQHIAGSEKLNDTP